MTITTETTGVFSSVVYCRVIAVVVALGLVARGVRANCPTVELRDAIFKSRNGRYSMTGDNCTRRPVYEHNSLYDLYHQGNYWLIEYVACYDNEGLYARAYSSAQYPENISVEYWEERDSQYDDWTRSYDLHIVCAQETEPTTESSPGSSSSGLSAGAIAGIIIGSLAFVALIFGIKKLHNKNNTNTTEQNNNRTDVNSTRYPTNNATHTVQEANNDRLNYSGYGVAMERHLPPADGSPTVSYLAPPPSYDDVIRDSSYTATYDNIIEAPDHNVHQPQKHVFGVINSKFKTANDDGTNL